MDGSSCLECNQENQIANDSTTPPSCSEMSVITLGEITVNEFKPSITVSCSMRSALYYAYGLAGPWTDSLTIEEIQAKTGTKTTNQIATSDTIQYWLGYGSLSSVDSTATTFAITSPLKNSGENYTIIAYCESYAGNLASSPAKGSWEQTSNGAQIVVLKSTTETGLTREQKIILGEAIKKALNIKNRMFTDENDECFDTASSRLLQTVSSTTTTFYLLPDYTSTTDTLYSTINSKISESSFINDVNSQLANSSIAATTAVYVSETMSTQLTPTFLTTTPKITSPTKDSISFPLTITNTDGYIYVGIGNNVTSGLRAPSWAQFMNSVDVFDIPLIYQYATYNATMGKELQVEIAGLESGNEYGVYFAAGNVGFPKLNTSIFALSAKTVEGSFGKKIDFCWVSVIFVGFLVSFWIG